MATVATPNRAGKVFARRFIPVFSASQSLCVIDCHAGSVLCHVYMIFQVLKAKMRPILRKHREMEKLMPIKFKMTLGTITLFLSLLNPAFAQDDETPYDASISLGYVGTTGNTEITTLNTQFLLTYREADWTHNFEFSGLSSRENGIGKAERYFIGDKSDYALMNENQYLYVQASYTDDRFSGFDYQAIASLGYGQYFIRNDSLTLEGFTGVGYRQNDAKLGGADGEAVFTLGESFDWEISPNSSVTQRFTADIGDKRTVTRFEIGLVSNIIDRIATKIAFEVRNTSDVPPGIKKTDTQTSISLVYTF